MNIYGCIPSPFLASPSTLTYWAHAASLAGITSSDPNLIASTSAALGLKKSHLPFNLCDVIRKSNSETTLRPTTSRASEDVPSSIRLSTSRVGSLASAAGIRHASISREDQERLQLHIHMQMQQLRRHHQHHQQQIQQRYEQDARQHHSHHQPFSASSPPPVGNGLAPLKALCDSDVSSFMGKSSTEPGTSRTAKALAGDDGSTPGGGDGNGLKFGINRILSDDFGKAKNEKGKTS
ncbi:hypothetical protein EGW08_023626 [Elysia chlorotica]|uniref:Uncharacterized protein n=1 Tax=Elysia chlorotica TaxID=188477 RepID=A0A3S1AUH0_ELYCH|nr:hypothetical protein EGW08_023626 [Elysia chlorotica]